MVCLERQHLIVFISRGAVPARELRSRIKVIQRLEIGWPQVVYAEGDKCGFLECIA